MSFIGLLEQMKPIATTLIDHWSAASLRAYGRSMATADDFRRIALAFPGAEERAHMDHPDFRIGGRIFATLPAGAQGMVALDPEQQELAMAAEPDAFGPASGAWGRQGSTLVGLDAVSNEWLERTLGWAFERRAAKPSSRRRPKSQGT
jgi:hypothetical protein